MAEQDTSTEFRRDEKGLSRPLRGFPPGRCMVEITTRTFHGLYLLKPTKDAKERMEGVLGRALELNPEIQLHAYWFLSNHYNLLVSAPDAPALSKFMNHVNSNLARELGALFGWHERFWGRRYRAIIVIGDVAQVRRLKYLLAQGSKDGLIYRPSEWPGATSLRALTEGINAIGQWFNRTKEYFARASRKTFAKYDFATPYELALTPLPCWADLSNAEQREKCREIVAEIEREAAESYARSGRRPVGVKKILRQSAHDGPNPKDFERSPAPMCHAETRAEHERFREFYYSFRAIFREASRRFRQGIAEALLEFPDNCFLPCRPPPPVREDLAVAGVPLSAPS
jgi:hypothetical protein